MSETSRRVLASCMTIAIVLCIFLSFMLIVGAGVMLLGSQPGNI
jgi:hypothetical protein